MPPPVRRTPWILRREALQLAALLLTALAAWGVAATHRELAHTVDEPTHVAAGMEWLEAGTQRLHPENPPLGRIGAGLAAHFRGLRLPASGTAPQRGTDVLYAHGDYLGNLRRARLATLPFFLLAVWIVWRWTDQMAGTRAAALATLALASLPPLLGHAGLATTDVPFVAMFLLALWSFVGWIDSPAPGRALLVGVALGLAIATKFSTLVMFPAGALAILLGLGRGDPTARALGRQAARVLLGVVILGLAAALAVWGAYRLELGTVAEIPRAEGLTAAAFPDADGLGRRLAEALTGRPMPAPDALLGLLFLKAHAVQGHPAYLLGSERPHGFWYFYPVALAVKTPLTFFALLSLAIFGLVYRPSPAGWRAVAPAWAAVAVLAVAMVSPINIGLRHVLVVYPLLAISIGVGLDRGLVELDGSRRRALGVGIAALLVWQVALLARVHPDYLAYFNPLAGREPGRVLVDSDLDWGQDALRLEEALRGRGVERLHIAYFGSVRLCELELPPLEHLAPGRPVRGWVAISEMYYRGHWRLVYPDVCDRNRTRPAPSGLDYAWLHQHRPVAIVGRSIRLYDLGDG